MTSCGQNVMLSVLYNLNEDFICIHYDKYIIIFFINTCIIQNVFKTPLSNIGFTQRFYGAHAVRPKRAHGALEDPTAMPHRPHGALCKRQAATLSLSMFKIIAAVWRSVRWHSVHLRVHSVAGDCTARTSAISNFFERCGNSVRTQLCCDRGLTLIMPYHRGLVNLLTL